MERDGAVVAEAGADGAGVEVSGTDGGYRGPWWGPGFDVVRRGYAREQVEEALDRAEADLRVVTEDRDALVRAEAEAQAGIRALRAEVARLATTPVSVDGVSARLQHLLRLVQLRGGALQLQQSGSGGLGCQLRGS